MTDKEKIKKALDIAEDGSIDGGHHKMWVIDQMIRALTDCPTIERKALDRKGNAYTYETMGESAGYLQWVKEFQAGWDGPETYLWNTGITP